AELGRSAAIARRRPFPLVPAGVPWDDPFSLFDVVAGEAPTMSVDPDPPGFTGPYAPDTPPSSAPQVLTDGRGTVIGTYKHLQQQLGEDGMGTIYVAEQEHPVKRRVALKVIKPGMDSAQVLRRFEAERQALALMDHTNIAKVFDAGTTETGRPYFVMELVKGE